MSSISVLGKRKSIDPSAKEKSILVDKEEAIFGEKKDATVCEKEKEAKEEAILVDKEEPILADKEQDATVVVGEKEKEGVDEDCVEIQDLRKLLAELNKELKQEMEEMKESGKTFEFEKRSDFFCRICLQPGHFNCPWEMGSSAATLPKVGPDFILLCPRCDTANFGKKPSSDVMCCMTCGCERIRAFEKICPWCLRFGHRSKENKDCVYSEEEWTAEKDPVLSYVGVVTSK